MSRCFYVEYCLGDKVKGFYFYCESVERLRSLLHKVFPMGSCVVIIEVQGNG